MNRSAMKLWVWVAGPVLYGALSGCAVLTVDVDVYKGALVNEEEVQLHQLVALTTAAQPMLVHLRDNLEWPDTEGKPPQGATIYPGNYSGDCEGKQWKGSWYETGYIKTPEDWVAESPKPWWRAFGETLQEWFTGPLCRPHFKNPYARAVNNVLSLYDDLADSDLAPHARKLRQAVEQLRRATSNPEKDRASYVELAAGFKPDTALTREELMNLKQGYRELLIASSGSEPSRKVGKLMDALKELRKKQKTIETHNELEADLLTKWAGTDTYKGKDDVYDRRLPFRAVWKLLGEGGTDTFLAQVTRKLCEEGAAGDRACATLLTRTKELADEYWKSRKAVRDIWLESLGLLAEIERLRRADSKVYDDLKSKVIRLIVEVTNVRHIASALDRLDRDGRCSLLRNQLRPGSFCEVRTDGNLVWSEINVKDQIGYFEEVLRSNLSSSPAETAHFLLYLDGLESTAPQKSGIANVLVEAANKANPQRIVRLGLNRSFIEDRKLEGSPELFDFVDDVSRKVAQGFERGRLPDGLHTLTEAFLKSHDGNTDTGDSHDEKKLLDALVEFAQKLLFLANHEGLSSPPGTSGLILGGAEKINRGLFGDSLTDAGLYGLFGSGLAERRKQQYVRVLQAVGNSILFSANELRERERYRDLSQKKVRAEVAAVNSTYSADPKKVLEDLLEELKAEQAIVNQKVSVARVRKTILEKELSDLVGTHLPVLSAKQATADAMATTAEATLATFQSATKALKGFHQVLITGGLVSKLPQVWGTPAPSVSTVECFLKIAMTSGNSCAGQWGGLATGGSADSIEQSVNREKTINWPTLTREQQETYREAIAYITAQEALQSVMDYRQREGRRSLKADDLLKDLTDHVRLLEQKRVADEHNLVAQADQARKTQADYQGDMASANRRIEALKAELSTIEALIVAHPFDSQKLENAMQEIGKLSNSVRKYVDAGGKYLSPREVYAQLEYLLKQQVVTATASQRISLHDAVDVLAKRRPPSEMPLLDPEVYANPREVMDELIALLRHRQMEAVARFGKDSEQDKKATEALENAYQHRAGMIYLRPSSAYLRTSFPSTSLQDDPNLVWDNMLLKQGIRNMPFSSQLRDILDPSVERDRLLTAELDKQYWQNINRVRVSGAGFTNQALVKDDVGNWYVKQYFGDTEDIVKSAKHLALYSLGTKLPIDLSHELTKAALAKDDSKKSDAEKEAELPPLQQVFIKHKVAYQAHTVELSTRLAELHGKDGGKALYNQVLTHWERDGELKKDADLMKALTAALGEEVNQWDKTHDPLKKASDEERGLAITKDLRALAKLERQLSARIRRSRNEEPAKSLAAKAADEVHKVVEPVLIALLKDHKQALDRYEQAILFIGDAANPKDPKEKQGK